MYIQLWDSLTFEFRKTFFRKLFENNFQQTSYVDAVNIV